MYLYYAGPLFTDAERAWNRDNCRRLREAFTTATFLVPHEFCAPFESSGKPDFAGIFQTCVAYLEQADVVLAVLDGPDSDSGTAWEAGYAFAKGIPVIGLRTDWRPAEDGASNCMLSRSCVAVVKTIEQAVSEIRALNAAPRADHERREQSGRAR